MKVVIVTGGFDPIHSGHIAYLEAAKKLGDLLVVGLNSDDWLTRKKGKPFMPWNERAAVLKAIKYVDMVYPFDDKDNNAIDAIRYMRDYFFYADLVFANGGDRTSENIPEMNCGIDRLEFVFSVGGDDKKNSSSWILNNWNKNEGV